MADSLLAEEVRSLIHCLCDGILDPVADLAHVHLADGGLVLDPLVCRWFPRPYLSPSTWCLRVVVVGDDGSGLLDGEGNGGHLVLPSSAVD